MPNITEAQNDSSFLTENKVIFHKTGKSQCLGIPPHWKRRAQWQGFSQPAKAGVSSCLLALSVALNTHESHLQHREKYREIHTRGNNSSEVFTSWGRQS